MSRHFTYVGGRNIESWLQIGDFWQATDDIYVRLVDDTGLHYTWHLLPGFRTNGASVPWAFRWFAPQWSDDNPVYNIAVALHDAAYGSGFMHRSIADDMMRGILRDAGLSRFKASTMCWAVNNFAASHYGEEFDTYDCKLFAKLTVYKE